MPGASGWRLLIGPGGLLVLGLLSLGAVGPAERATLHAALALAVAAAWWRGGTLSRDAVLGFGLLVAAVLPGLLPVPRGALEALAPGVAAARPLEGAATLSLRPDRTLDALASVLLAAGAWAVVADARARGLSEGLATRALAWLGVGVAALGVAHASVGAGALFGVVPIRPHDGRFYAPLINPNHHGAVLVALWPAAAVEAARAWRSGRWTAWVFGALVAWAWCFPVVASSAGLVLALGAQAVAVLVAARPRPILAALASVLGVAGLGGLVAAVVWRQPEWWTLSAGPRFAQWADAWPMWRAAPWTGVGAGAYGAAYPPWQTVRQFATFDHLHADWLQAIVEVGLVGAALGAAGGVVLLRGWAPGPLALGLLGLAAHGLVDFPWRVPGVMLVGVALAVGVPGPGSRRALAAVAMGQVVAGVWQGLRAREDRVAAGVLEGTAAPAERAWLEARAPWRAEPLAADLSAATELSRVTALAARAEVAHPGDAALLRLAAHRLRRAGDAAGAGRVLDAALRAGPQDYRTWLLRSGWRAADGDALGAAEDRAEAFRRWPREQATDGAAFDEAFGLLPIGVWWLDALRDAPAHWSVRLAWRALDDQDFHTALLATEQAARLRPAVHAWMPAHAEALAGLGRADAAVRYLRDWQAAEPDVAWAWSTLARVGEIAAREEWIGEGIAMALILDPAHPAVQRPARRLVGARPGCPAPGCVAGGPAGELWAAWRAREAGDVAGCESARRAAAEDPAWAVRLKRSTWSCGPN